MSLFFQRKLSGYGLPLLIFLITASLLALYFGMMDSSVRLLLVGTILFAVLTGVSFLHRLFRDNLRARICVLLVLLLPVAILSVKLVTGGRATDKGALRSLYIQRMRSYLGVKYSWGGETRLGIDCSGLARTGLEEAMLAQGWQDGNSRSVWPTACRLWRRDTSAKGMLDETYGYTRRIGHADELSDTGSIRMNSGMSLLPGDLAVTDGGVHVMIYTGNGRWIEANPDDGRVVENNSSHSERGYFNMSVTILRWWILE